MCPARDDLAIHADRRRCHASNDGRVMTQPAVGPAITPLERATLVARGQRLSTMTLGYNCIEGVASIVAGALAGSISLVGFGVDSVIECQRRLKMGHRHRLKVGQVAGAEP